VIWRILFVYIGVAFFFGLTCPSDADGLANGASRALKSPMTIALQNAGWNGGVHLINAFIFITVISAANSSIYIGSRTILFMAQQKMAPKFLGWTNSRGVPVYAIIFTNLFGAISMMNISTGGGQAYSYIVNLSGVSTFLVWGSISFTHIRFRKAWSAQGRTKDMLPFKSLAFPWIAYFGLAANIFLALVQGWTTLSPFDAGTFVDAYILLPIFGIIFVGYKFWFKTRFWRSHEIDLDSGMRKDMDTKDEYLQESHDESQGKQGFLKRVWQKF
jgi:amino acid transporter